MESFAILLSVFLFGSKAIAHPEYAVRYNINSCTACHLSPVGGGPRNINGKLFGAHNYKMNQLLAQDYVSADFRALYYYPQRVTDSKGGMGIMSGSVAGHVALDEAHKIHLVMEQNIAGFSQAQYRDSYALYKFSEEGKSAWFESLMVGRFRAPFGFITDEHRTYTRIQSATEWYAMETGALLSGAAPRANLHYDWAVLSGDHSTGQTLPQGGAPRWGSVLNLRYLPGAVLLGASYSHYSHVPARDSRKAASLSAIVSLARWSDNKIPVTLQFEHVRAWNFGSNLGNGFAGDAAYVASLASCESRGWLFLADWAVSEHFAWIYEFDYLTPDKNFPADYFQRHGFGFKWLAGPNVWVQVRTELARATPPTEAGSSDNGAQNASYALLQLAF